MIGWLVAGGVLGAAASAFWLLIVRLGRWNDPTWDTQEAQARAFLWSQRAGSGGWGS